MDNSCAPVIGQDLMTQLGMSMDFGTKQVHHAEGLSNMEAGPVSSGDVLGVDACKLPDSMTCPVPAVVSDLVAHNPDLVSKDIRTFLGFEHQIKLSPEAVPTAVKTQPIPYAIVDKVADAVRLLDQQGIWEKASLQQSQMELFMSLQTCLGSTSS